MKTKNNHKKKADARIHVHAGATLKIPTCETCEDEVIWIGQDWYHARTPDFEHFARLGEGRTLCIPDYPTEASIGA